MGEVKDQKNLSLLDEGNLVLRAQQRDSQALSVLYEAYFDKIYRYIVMRVRNEAEAEDITQQVFMKMLDSIASYKSRGVPFSSWLFRIAHNQVIDFYRQQGKKATVDIEGIQLPDGGDDPQHMMEMHFDIEEVKKATQNLTAAQQEVLSLRFASELSIAECAAVMGKKEGAIKALQHSAVVALRKALTGKEP
ncbi:MAG: sigma-70 family RNA polymerase sigma factor [Dehalococcoidales bacterium]|nr:sigma-70 family RNA polymerase sigma factor [Dehalococcoidales bacterium]